MLGLAFSVNAALAARHGHRAALAVLPVAGMMAFLVVAGLHGVILPYLWAYVMPPLVMAMAGPAWGLGASGVILLVLLAMLRLAPPDLPQGPPTFSIATSYLTTILLAWLYEKARLDRERELAWLSTHDDLTGALNRRAFREAVRAALDDLRRSFRPVSVVLIDVDHFKAINDTWGHAAGDAVLQCIADAARGNLGPDDDFGRLGGDEFAVLCRGPTSSPDGQGAAAIAGRIRRDVEALEFAFGARATVTLGVAEAWEGDTVDSLLARADRALYAAKRAGRNAVRAGTRAGRC